MSFSVPGLAEFPKFLKTIESRWRVKLMRRLDRERFVGSKEELAAKGLPRYVLSMFPYPSGRLHLGHVRIYTSGDILARFSRLLMKNGNFHTDYSYVINPMGFDSFGLPAENAARERGLDPAAWTNANIRTMKQQLDDLALQFDWREATSNPSYYKWTQNLFLQLMHAGLVYKSYGKVNWDPVDKTVLADEQVNEEGRSWRSGALVEKKNLRQWFIKTNSFTNDIYHATDIDPESWKDILAIQRNWIGKPCGWMFYLPVRCPNSPEQDTIPIFTKKPEMFLDHNAQLVISRDHWLQSVHRVSDTGHLRNPFTGDQLKVKLTEDTESLPENCLATLASTELNPSAEESMDGHGSPTRDQVILQAKLNGLGGYFTSDKYRDWLISRQRFWGTPIPVINCPSCGYQGVPKERLPVTLPKVADLSSIKDTKRDTSHTSSPIEELAPNDWLEVECPSCNSPAKRECETVDTLFDSSWYFLRYSSSPSPDEPFNPNLVQPVWTYVGGKEHASMHLFYARFITHFLYSKGLLKFREPFSKLLVQGVVKGKTYKLDGRYLSPSQLANIQDKNKLSVEYDKMSKSKGNGVDPEELIDDYGVDATRFCLMSYANPRSERLWRSNEEEFKDVLMYLRRVALTVQEYVEIGQSLRTASKSGQEPKVKNLSPEELDLQIDLIVKARNKHSIDGMFNIQETNQFRQYIATIQAMTSVTRSSLNNSLVYTKEFAETLAALIVMLNPIVPHLSEELWANFSQCVINPLRNDNDSQYKTSLQARDQPWPVADKNFPLEIKVRHSNSGRIVARLPVSQEQFRVMSKQDLANMVESHYKSLGDSCKVTEVQKFADLMAVVDGRIDSVERSLRNKKKKSVS